MKKFFTIFYLIAGTMVQAQINIDKDRWIRLLDQQKAHQVFTEASLVRKEKYGRCALVDYFIAKSLCVDQKFKKSGEWFDYILKNYPLDEPSSTFMDKERSSCRQNNTRTA